MEKLRLESGRQPQLEFDTEERAKISLRLQQAQFSIFQELEFYPLYHLELQATF
jgi:hypothetical protein